MLGAMTDRMLRDCAMDGWCLVCGRKLRGLHGRFCSKRCAEDSQRYRLDARQREAETRRRLSNREIG